VFARGSDWGGSCAPSVYSLRSLADRARARVQCFVACLLLARVQISEEFPYRLLFALPSFEAGLLTAFALVWPNQSLMGPAPKFVHRLRKIRHALREGSLLVVWRTSPNAFASEEHGSTC
jgi:hypothetical protein